MRIINNNAVEKCPKCIIIRCFFLFGSRPCVRNILFVWQGWVSRHSQIHIRIQWMVDWVGWWNRSIRITCWTTAATITIQCMTFFHREASLASGAASQSAAAQAPSPRSRRMMWHFCVCVACTRGTSSMFTHALQSSNDQDADRSERWLFVDSTIYA